jgi:hypothetical protein
LAKIKAQYPDAKSVLVTGTVPSAQHFFENIQTGTPLQPDLHITFADNISYHTESVEKADSADVVVLVEQLGLSNKKEVQREIKDLDMLNKTIFGVVLFK